MPSNNNSVVSNGAAFQNNASKYIPYSREQKHVSISDTPMLLIEINSISNMGRQK